MERSAKFAKIALLAVLLNGAALVFPKDTWAADRLDFQVVSQVLDTTWNFSDRSLTTFGNLIVNPQEPPVVALLRPKAPKPSTMAVVLETKPEASTETIPTLDSKILQTEAVAKELFVSTSYAKSEAGLLGLKWTDYSGQDAASKFYELQKKFGQETDSSTSDSIFGRASYLSGSWNWSSTTLIADRMKTIGKILNDPAGLTYENVQTLSSLFNELDSLVGDTSDPSEKATLHGQLSQTKNLASLLSQQTSDLGMLLSKWDSYSQGDKEQKLNDIALGVKSINQIPGLDDVLSATPSGSDKDLKNKSYAVLGVANANKQLLTDKPGQPLNSSWLELGSVVFKNLIFNPSNTNTQEMTVDYYLPPEVVKQEDVIEIDPSLVVLFDSSKKQYHVTGKFVLNPQESKIVYVRVNDLWIIDQKEISKLSEEASEAYKPFSKVAFLPYFSEGTEIKRQIDESLDKAMKFAKESEGSPEEEIKSYRLANDEISKASNLIEKLQEKGKIIPF